MEKIEKYKGHTIEVRREKCLGDWFATYYDVFRDADGLHCVGNFSEGEDSLEHWVDFMKERIDEELTNERPWEHEE